MVYISGEKDTLQQLKENEGVTGGLSVYEKLFTELNPELCAKFPNYKQRLPAYMPIFLISEDPVLLLERQEIWYELSKFSETEKQKLRALQEDGVDFATQVATTSIMEDLQEYAAVIRQWLKTPLILTPWTHFNDILTNKSWFKVVGEGSSHVSGLIKGSSLKLDLLFEDMLQQDNLNRQLHMLRDQKGPEVMKLRQSLETQIKTLTGKIKQQLPKRIDASMTKYLNKRFPPDVVRRLRSKCYYAKAARGEKFLTTNLNVLNRSGLARLRDMVSRFRTLGTAINTGAKMLNYLIVLYDTYQAYMTGGNIARTFITGGLAVYLSAQAVAAVGGTAALGGLVIGGGITASNLILGTTILVSCPIAGWALLVVGIVAAAAVSYAAKKSLEGVWDLGEPVSKEVYKKAAEATGQMREQIKSAWSEKSDWLLDFYGTKKPNQSLLGVD
ncbi:MAG TPA: hypothetical protein VMR37_03690 [Rhabdochlamydiaceae bacterium]|nr:hypothetical protein [Rhabdochlamydiaceae bacterium]